MISREKKTKRKKCRRNGEEKVMLIKMESSTLVTCTFVSWFFSFLWSFSIVDQNYVQLKSVTRTCNHPYIYWNWIEWRKKAHFSQILYSINVCASPMSVHVLDISTFWSCITSFKSSEKKIKMKPTWAASLLLLFFFHQKKIFLFHSIWIESILSL